MYSKLSRRRICSKSGKQIIACGPRRRYAGSQPRNKTTSPSSRMICRVIATRPCLWVGVPGDGVDERSFIDLDLRRSNGAATVVATRPVISELAACSRKPSSKLNCDFRTTFEWS